MLQPAHPHLRRPPSSTRGFTLIEMMIVVAMVGIIAAIAVPNLMPVLHAQKVAVSAETVANLLDRARRKSVGTGFCHRVRLDGAQLVLEARTSPNCITNLGNTQWSDPLERVTPEPGVTFTVEATTGTQPNTTTLILKPSGRLLGDNDLDVTDDGGRILVRHGSSTRTLDVRINSLGRVCATSYTGTQAMPSPIVCGLGSATAAGANPTCSSVGGESAPTLGALLLGLFGLASRRKITSKSKSKGKSAGSRRPQRGLRGYLLIEVVISGAILAVVLGATVTAIAKHRVETARASRRAQAAMYAQEALAYAIAQNPPVCPAPTFDPPDPFALTCTVTVDTPVSTPALDADMYQVTVDVTYPSATEIGVTKTTSHQARVRSRDQVFSF